MIDMKKSLVFLHGYTLCLVSLYQVTAQQVYQSRCNDINKQYLDDELIKLKRVILQEIATMRATTTALSQSSSFVCAPPWVSFKTSCYFFSNDYGTWLYGKAQCEQKRGSSKYLRINDREEDAFIRNFVRSRGISAYERRDYWIGGTDAGQDGVFKWEGYSQNFSFSNWGPNNPDRLNSADCVILYQPSDYKWHDTSCTNDNSYICEIEF
uniref:Perlucin-like protein n=1 Tax=Crassostrea virginica TaxID=6565 RepID=A0A8B8BNB5_CRAVI|nr:perlucin-like protein [Crassostrea virginica]